MVRPGAVVVMAMVAVSVMVPVVVALESMSTHHDLRLRCTSFAGQHEGHKEDDHRTAHGSANELTWVGGGVLPRRF